MDWLEFIATKGINLPSTYKDFLKIMGHGCFCIFHAPGIYKVSIVIEKMNMAIMLIVLNFLDVNLKVIL